MGKHKIMERYVCKPGYGYTQDQGVEQGRAAASLVRLLIMHLSHHPRPLCHLLYIILYIVYIILAIYFTLCTS